jgi:tyrosinase
VSGIHGFPQIPWDGAEKVEHPPQPGYAAHNSVTFGPWRRVYLAAYEQVISQLAQDIAARHPANQHSRYQQAASTFRIPFWDWALSSTLPACITSPTTVVNTPQERKTITNPLVGYTFHPTPGAALSLHTSM